jgi:hypothetical protein
VIVRSGAGLKNPDRELESPTGEGTSPPIPGLPGEAEVIAGTANYESTTGTVTMSITTAGLPVAESELTVGGALLTTSRPCDRAALEPPAGGGFPEVLPAFEIRSVYTETEEETPIWVSIESFSSVGPEDGGPATKSVSGTTTTLSATTDLAANRPYDCAFVSVNENGGEPIDYVFFPIAVPPVPPVTPPAVAPAPAVVIPAPAALLSLAKLKPLSAKTGKWTKVKLKVTNSGNAAAGPVAIKAKAPKGVVVKPLTTKLPALLPGQSWTVVLEVQLTAKAKKSSTISLTGTLPGLTATSSVVIKSAD